jgi:hypothetical protein
MNTFIVLFDLLFVWYVYVVFLFYFIVVRRATCVNRSTIFRSLLRQVSSSPCPTKVFVTCSIVVEEACVGVTIAYVLVALLLC